MELNKITENILKYIPNRIRSIMCKTPLPDNLTEIRFYSNRGIAFFTDKLIGFLSDSCDIVKEFDSHCIKVTSDDCKFILMSVCKNSVYSHQRELNEGCFVIENGVRVGLSGRFSEGQVQTIQEISSINFRISREKTGCAEQIYESTKGNSLLICGGVNTGKTTILRDLSRLYGNHTKCTLIDEHNEISAMNSGIPSFDIGLTTDIINGKSRHNGIISSIRTLSPEYIMCDEIADSDDVNAIVSASGSGVKIIATMHCPSYQDFQQRPVAKQLMNYQIFSYAVFLKNMGQVDRIVDLRIHR